MAVQMDLSALEAWTIQDVLDFETHSGMDFDQLSALAETPDGARPKLPLVALTCFLWISRRHAEPDFSWEDALKTRLTDLAALVPPVPTPAPAARRKAARQNGS